MIVDSIKKSFFLPVMKGQEVKSLCEKALEVKRVSLCNIASILGSFTWTTSTIPYAQSHYRSMQRFYLNESKKATRTLIPNVPYRQKGKQTWVVGRQSGSG